MVRKLTEKVTVAWFCESCNKDIETKELYKHLKEVHKTENKQGRRELQVHFDFRGGGWASTYKWTLPDCPNLSLLQTTTVTRSKE